METNFHVHFRWYVLKLGVCGPKYPWANHLTLESVCSPAQWASPLSSIIQSNNWDSTTYSNRPICGTTSYSCTCEKRISSTTSIFKQSIAFKIKDKRKTSLISTDSPCIRLNLNICNKYHILNSKSKNVICFANSNAKPEY